MKKLTLALLSLMLFLGMGTAFAQDAPATLPDMTYTPSSGSTVAPGDRITFDVPEAYQENMIFLFYTTDFSAFANADTYEGKMAILNEASDEDYDGPIMTAGYMGEWMMPCQIPDDAQPGQLVMLAFWMAVGGEGAPEASDVMTLTYTVAGEAAKVNPPVFTPGEGTIAQGGEVELSCDASGTHYICYVLNDPDFDEYLDWEDDTDVKTKYVYNTSDAGHTHIFINEETTIKAWVVTLDYMDAITGISEAVVATYTPVAPPAAPVFNPNGGKIASDAPIALTTTSTDATIYYTMGDASAFDGIKTQEDLDRAMLMQYFDDEQPTLEMFGMEEAGDEVMLAAAAAFIDEDGNITWSAVTTATFTVAGGEEPAITVEQPVITPGTAEGVIALNQKVKIECATEGAEIYYTTDGKAPYTADNDGNPVAVADNAIKYTAPFSVPEGKKVDDELSIRAVAVKDGVFSIGARANLMIEAAVVVAAPTFEPAAGEVAFGTALVLNSADEDAVLYYTTDGTEPTEESAEFNPWWDEIAIWKSMTVKAIAVVDGIASEVATAVYTVAPVENATLTLEPMKEDTVGKNVGTGISFTDGTAESERWIQNLPATVYYTTDGTTVPSKAAYEAQADKDNGAIKMVAVKWEDQYGWYGPVQDGEGNLLSLTFTEATHLKAIGCLMDGDEVLITTALLDTMLNIKAEANATFSLADYSKVAVGDKLVIENPNYYDEFDMEMPAWPEDYFDNEESAKAYDEAMAKYDEAYAAYAEEIAKLPQTELYFSFDGTKPTVANRYADDLNVFSMRAGGNVEITFAQDETGYYAYIPAVRGYNSPDDTVRLGEDGILSVQVLCVTTETATEEGGDPMPLSARWGRPGGAAPFVYGSDFTVATYAVKDILIAAPTFSVKAGEVEKGTKVELACETEGAVIYYTVDGAEPTAESTEYKEAITIDKAITVKAIAIKGDFKSEVATAAYTIKTANEDEELAGVSVYPNPSNGLFNIELPVAATIEVFASNGVLTQRVNAGAGNATLNINRSGIYFLRITGEGRTAIKRIIVR